MLLTPQSTPIQEISSPVLTERGVRLFLKRLDKVHPVISGNKWYKLKYNLLAAREQGFDTLLSFGGAFSNHIHALAGAGAAYGFKTIGIIRGELHTPLNPTLAYAQSQDMQLHYLSRSEYRDKYSPRVIESLKERFGDFYLVPEGGSNALAVRGCAEIINDIDIPFDVVATACGTGGTLAGIVAGLQGKQQALGVSVLKGGDFLTVEVNALLQQATGKGFDNWSIELEYHFGGYAKVTPELMAFIKKFEEDYAIPLDPVYTGKLLLALLNMVELGRFPEGTRLLALHTGGVQGRAGFGLL